MNKYSFLFLMNGFLLIATNEKAFKNENEAKNVAFSTSRLDLKGRNVLPTLKRSALLKSGWHLEVGSPQTLSKNNNNETSISRPLSKWAKVRLSFCITTRLKLSQNRFSFTKVLLSSYQRFFLVSWIVQIQRFCDIWYFFLFVSMNQLLWDYVAEFLEKTRCNLKCCCTAAQHYLLVWFSPSNDVLFSRLGTFECQSFNLFSMTC